MKINYNRMSWWAQILAAPFLLPMMAVGLVCIVIALAAIISMLPCFFAMAVIAALDGGKGFE